MLHIAVVWSSGGGGGGGGCINVRDEHFSYVTEHVHVALAVVWSSGGWGGCINVLDEHFSYVTEHVAVVDMLHMLSDALLLDFLREPILVPRVIPTKDSRWPKSTTNNISLLRLIIFEVVCGVNPIEPLLLLLNK